MKGFTTTADLPPDIQERYELTEPLEGGPVFDFPHYKQYNVDFSKLTEHMADTLVKRRLPWIRRKPEPATTETTPATLPAKSKKAPASGDFAKDSAPEKVV